MPRRVTVDEYGLVVSLKFTPERESPPSTKKSAGSKPKKQKFPWIETKAKKVLFESSRPKTKKKAKKSVPRVLCPVCHTMVGERALYRHVQNLHPAWGELSSEFLVSAGKVAERKALDSGSWVYCSDCEVHVKEQNWKKHVRKVHPHKVHPLERNRKERRVTIPTKPSPMKPTKKNPSKPKRSVFDTRNSEKRGRQYVRELFEEGRYGDKYVGLMRREPEGKFGSLPLYDDYGEESGPS